MDGSLPATPPAALAHREEALTAAPIHSTTDPKSLPNDDSVVELKKSNESG
jgi:hypothetical protein